MRSPLFVSPLRTTAGRSDYLRGWWALRTLAFVLVGFAATSVGLRAQNGSAGLSYPLGLACDSAGNLYVTNVDASYANIVSKVTPEGIVTTFVASDAGLSGPMGLACDSAGNLYVANSTANTVSKVTPGGVVTTFVASDAGLSNPFGLAFDSSGNLYVTNVDANTVSKVTPGGVVTTFVASDAGLPSPTYLACDSLDNLYVNSWGTVSKITPRGSVTPFVASGFPLTSPSWMAIDSTGNLYVSNSEVPYTVCKITPEGFATTFAGGFNPPTGLAFDKAGNLYVADSMAGTLSKFTFPPTVTTPTSASVGATTATLGGNVTSAGSAAITARGVVYSITSADGNPQIGGTGVTNVAGTGTTGVFTVSATELTVGTGYSYSAYATNSIGTTYSPVGTFTTVNADATLSALALSAGTLSPAFASGTTSYTASVANGTTSLTVTPTATQASATITVNGTTVASSGAISLNVGSNTITTVVTAPDGTTTNTYTTTVTRAALAPTLTTPTSASVAGTTATLGGNVTSDGGATVTARGVVYSITSANSNPQIGGTGVTNVTSTGSTGVFTVNVTGLTATAYTYAAYATNSVGTTYTSTGTFTTVLAPVISSSLTASGTYGSAISIYTITASNTPASYSATGLPPDLSINTNNGQITGTPTATAGSPYSVTISATNAGGTGSATLVFTVSEVIVTVTLGSTTQTYDGSAKNVSVTTSPAGLSTSISYGGNSAAPVNAGSYPVTVDVTSPGYSGTVSGSLTITKGTATVTLGTDQKSATTTPAGLAVTLTFNGSTVVPSAPGTYAVAATVTDPNYIGSASGTFVIAKFTQTIAFSRPGAQRADAGALTVGGTASSGLPVTITLVSGPAILSSSSLTLTGASGTVVLVASQAGNDTYAAAPDVIGTFTVTAVGPQIFFGSTGSNDTIAAYISADGTTGTTIGYLAGTKQGFVVNFQVNSDGTFTAPATTFTGNSTASSESGPRMTAAAVHPVAELAATLTFQGRVVNGVISGSIVELALSFSLDFQSPAGPSAGVAGYYQAAATNTASGNTYSIVGTKGQVYVLAVTPNIVATGTATLAANNTFTAQAQQNATIVGSIDQPTTTVTGTICVPGQPATNFSGLATTTTRTDRLINLSTRAQVGTGSATLITGFVIGGTTPKQVLLRAVGPGLASFGFCDMLSNPRLVLFDHTGTVIAQNFGWPSAAAVVMSQVGAFPLSPGSADAAILTTLAPGTYTMHVVGGGTGIALAEVYDASVNPQAQYQRLINISTRGAVGAGDGVLIGGFVVTGNSPKMVLIRGVGPALTAFGVQDTLSDPKLAVYSGSAVIAQNNDWGTPTTLNAAQTAATASQIASAAQATGAFALMTNSKDSAVIVSLAPGAYTVQVSSANGATGVAMVEIYEMP